MDIQVEKIELVKRLLDTDDEVLLTEVKAVLDSHQKDFWDELPQYVKDGINRGQQQAKQGLLTSHDEVIKKYQKYL